MKYAYGYKVTAADLAYLGADRVIIDTDRKRKNRQDMIRLKLRKGDTLALMYLRHLGGSPVADRVWREKVEAKGVTVEIKTPPPKPKGRPHDYKKLPREYEMAVRAIWQGDGTEAVRLDTIREIVGHPVGKGLLDARFPRNGT